MVNILNIIKIECEYNNGKLNGNYIQKYSNGVLHIQMTYKNNIREEIKVIYTSMKIMKQKIFMIHLFNFML